MDTRAQCRQKKINNRVSVRVKGTVGAFVYYVSLSVVTVKISPAISKQHVKKVGKNNGFLNF